MHIYPPGSNAFWPTNSTNACVCAIKLSSYMVYVFNKGIKGYICLQRFGMDATARFSYSTAAKTRHGIA